MSRLQIEKRNRKRLIIILFILFFFLGTSYSLLTQDLSISGKINIPTTSEDKIVLTGSKIDSVEAYKIFGFVLGYRIYFTVTNNTGEDITNWIAVISAPNITGLQSIVSSTTEIKVNSYAVLDSNTNTVTITVPDGDSNGIIKNGESVKFVLGATGADTATLVDCYYLKTGISLQSESDVTNVEDYTINNDNTEMNDVQIVDDTQTTSNNVLTNATENNNVNYENENNKDSETIDNNTISDDEVINDEEIYNPSDNINDITNNSSNETVQ